MTDDFYKKAFDTAIEELAALTKHYEDLMKEEEILELRMEKLRSGAISLAVLANLDFQKIKEEHPDLFEQETNPPLGITDAVREALRSSDEMLTAGEIADRVYKLNPSVAGHKNPMASIHAILRRLMNNGQILTGDLTDGKYLYGWVDCDDAEERIRRWFRDPEETLEVFKKRKKEKGK